jgi:hypothetical protein
VAGKQHGKILKKKKNLNRLFPKLWYGWIGKGTKNNWQLETILEIY